MTETQAKAVIELWEVSRLTVAQIAKAPTVRCTESSAQKVIDGDMFPELRRIKMLPHWRVGNGKFPVKL